MTYHRLSQGPCENCGATIPEGPRTKRFCSDRCRTAAYHRAHRPTPPARACLACGEEFTPKKDTARFCSDRCIQRAWQRRKRSIPIGPQERNCWWCDTPFLAVRNVRQQFCSPPCKQAATAIYAHKSRYGITAEQYRDLWRAQDGRCAICHQVQAGRRQMLAVDHAHDDDGHVRGLLCDNCNRAIGLLGDSPDVLDQAAAYLRQPEPALRVAARGRR